MRKPSRLQAERECNTNVAKPESVRAHGCQQPDIASAAFAVLALLVSVCTAGCRRAGEQPVPFALPPASDEADFVKTAESLDSPRYQHLYLGLGGVGVLIGPDGTNSEIVETTAPRPGIFPAGQWSGTSRVGGFRLSSEVSSRSLDEWPTKRSITDFEQRLEIRRGIATTLYSEAGRQRVRCRVTSFVTPDGVWVLRFEARVPGRYEGLRRQVALVGEGTADRNGWWSTETLMMLVGLGQCRAAAVCDIPSSCIGASSRAGDEEALESASLPLDGAESSLTAFVATGIGTDSAVVAEAEQRASRAQVAGFDALQQRTAAWWEQFWDASAVTLPQNDLSTWYKRSLYYLGAMTAGADSPPGPMGPLRLRWGGRIFAHDLTYMHYALLTSNHVAEAAQIAQWYYRMLPAARANAEQRYALPGARYGWEQNASGDEAARPPFSEAHHVNGEVALQAYMQAMWGDPGDEPALAQAREILGATTRFLCEHMEWDERLKAYVSPESTDLDENARLIRGGVSTQMATTWCLEACRELGVAVSRAGRDACAPRDPCAPRDASASRDASAPEDMRGQVYVPTAKWGGKEVVVVYAGDSPERKIKHPAPLVGIWWWPVLSGDSELAKATYENVLSRIDLDRTPTFNRPWLAAVAARMGRGDESLRLLKELLEAEGAIVDDTCFAEGQGNRWTYFLTTCGALVSAVNEMLLQSYEPDTIRVFPALPESWRDKRVGFERLRARGGVLVSADYGPKELRITLASPRSASRWVVFPRPASVTEPVATVDSARRAPESRASDRLAVRVRLQPERPTHIVVDKASTT